MEILKKYDLLDEVIALSADNTNTNLGGAKRKGRNNVFWKLGQKIDSKLELVVGLMFFTTVFRQQHIHLQ
jgi:hypothetical protein